MQEQNDKNIALKLRSAGAKDIELKGLDLIAQRTLQSPEAREAFRKLTTTSFFGKQKRRIALQESTEVTSEPDMATPGDGSTRGGAEGEDINVMAVLNTLCDKFAEMQDKSQRDFMTFLQEKQREWQNERAKDVQNQQAPNQDGAVEDRHTKKDRILIKPPPSFTKPTPMRTTEQFLDSYKAYATGMTNDESNKAWSKF